MVCFIISLKASNKGWTKPMKETLLGPKRIWKDPMTFRSNKVKKATDKRIRRQWINQHKKEIKEYSTKNISSFED